MILHKDDRFAVFNIALEKDGENRKKNYNNTAYSYLVTHPSTNPAEQGLNFAERTKHISCGSLTLR